MRFRSTGSSAMTSEPRNSVPARITRLAYPRNQARSCGCKRGTRADGGPGVNEHDTNTGLLHALARSLALQVEELPPMLVCVKGCQIPE